MDHLKHNGQGGEDGGGVRKGNQQTAFDVMDATLTDKDITLKGQSNLYDLPNFAPNVTRTQVEDTCGIDVRPGKPGEDISDMGFASSYDGQIFGPEHRPKHPYQDQVKLVAQGWKSAWSDMSHEEKSNMASNLGYSVYEIEEDLDTAADFVGRLTVEQEIRKAEGREKASASATSGVDTGIKPDYSNMAGDGKKRESKL